MSSMPDRSSDQRRRSFLILVVALAVAAAAVAFVLSRGDDGASGTATPPSSSTSVAVVTLQTACAEVAPDMALRVDALRRTAQAVRDDIAAMRAQGNTDDATQATQVAVALENMADAQENQHGVDRATRELGQTLTSVC